MQIIANHLKSFYVQYADENGLTLATVSSVVNTWDRQQFEDAINEFMQNVNPDDALMQRLSAARAKAMIDKRQMLNSVIAVGIDAATTKTKQFGQPELVRQYVHGYHARTGNQLKPEQVPPKIRVQGEFNSRLQVHSDVMATRMQETLNKALQRGLQPPDLKQLLKRIPPASTLRENRNLSSDMDKILSQIRNLTRDQAVRNTNQGANRAMDEDGVEYVIFLTQNDSRVCDICASLDGQVFERDEAPNLPGNSVDISIPVDTHYGCRCQEIPSDADGNPLPGYLH